MCLMVSLPPSIPPSPCLPVNSKPPQVSLSSLSPRNIMTSSSWNQNILFTVSFISITLTSNSSQTALPLTSKQFVSDNNVQHDQRMKQENLNLKFPDSNSLTEIDQKYFKMIQSEADWGNYTLDADKEEGLPWMDQPTRRVKIDSHGYPESFSLTEMDREYFNMIKTEDGHSGFFKTGPTPLSYPNKNLDQQKHIENNLLGLETKEKVGSHQSFRYHIVKNKNSKPIVGIYIPLDKN